MKITTALDSTSLTRRYPKAALATTLFFLLALPFLLFITAKDGWHKVVKALLVILALGVCYSRVMLGAHYASDVLAGVGMALIWVPLVTLLANKLLARMNSRVLARAVFVWAGILVGLMLFMTVA